MKKLIFLLMVGSLAFAGMARAQNGLPPYDVFLRYYLNMRTARGSVKLPDDHKAYVAMVYYFVDGREVSRRDLGLTKTNPGTNRLVDAQLLLQYTSEQRFIGAMLMVGEVHNNEYGSVIRDNLTSQVTWWQKVDGPMTMFKTDENVGQYNGYTIVLTASSQEPAVGGGRAFYEKYHMTVAVGIKSNADPMILQNEISTPRNLLDLVNRGDAAGGNNAVPLPAGRGAQPATPPPAARPPSPAGSRPGSPGASAPPAAPASGSPNILQ